MPALDQTAEVAAVVVRAELPPARGDAAFSIIEIAPRMLAVSERLDAALASEPGFSLFRRTSSLGANPTTQGASLRGIAGSGASRALVTLDGVPQNDPFGGWVIWTALPPEAIGGARLVRGAGAGPYGAGALTGVVALESADTDVADAEGGSLGYARAATNAGLGGAATRLFLDASGEHSDGWIPVIAGRGAADRPLSLTDWSAAARLEGNLGGTAASARLAAWQEERGAGTLDAGSRARGAQASVTVVQAPVDGGQGWRLQGWLTLSDLKNDSAALSADRNSASLANDQYATPAVGAGLNAAVRGMGVSWSWEAGADARLFSGESRERLFSQGAASGTRTSGGEAVTAGVYAEASRTVGATLVTGGLRLDGWGDFGAKLVQTGATTLNEHPSGRGGAAPTGRLGLRRDLGGGLYARAAAYAGFRPATLNELHRPFRVGNDVTEANPGLSPERLYGIEAGVGGTGALRWDGDVFFNRLANAVTNVTIGHGPGSFPGAGFVPPGGTLFERRNAGTIDAWGVEGEARRNFGPAVTARAAFSFTHARVDGGGAAPQLTGRRPAETPAATLTAGLDWRAAPRLTLGMEVRYESARFDDDLNTRKIDAGAGVDLRAAWRLKGPVSVFVAAENVFDAHIETGRSAAGVVTYDAPRLLRVGLTWRR
jgi:outer membrane receptor protein involved in Fe transport